MARIYKYQKRTDAHTTHCLAEPDYGREGEERITELCTIDGETYVSVPDSITLPPQPQQITVEAVALTEELDAAIKAASPHVALINERVVTRIRDRYSINDEIKMHRIGPSPETEAYNDWVEECRAWGRAEKERLMSPPIRDRMESWLASKEALAVKVDEAIAAKGKLEAMPVIEQSVEPQSALRSRTAMGTFYLQIKEFMASGVERCGNPGKRRHL
jgi:hypothetical protein